MPAIRKLADCKTDADRKVLAAKVLAMREDGMVWDGPNGICAALGLSGAPQGRALLRGFAKRKGRKVGTGNGIAKSYERTQEFREAESQRRQEKAQPKPQPKARKRAAKVAK